MPVESTESRNEARTQSGTLSIREAAHQFPLGRDGGTETDAEPMPTRPDPLPWGAITHPCGAWWTGLGRSHCPACHRTFSCDSAAELHRKGPYGPERHCVDPAAAGLTARRKPWGVMWQHPAPEDGRDTRRTTTEETR